MAKTAKLQHYRCISGRNGGTRYMMTTPVPEVLQHESFFSDPNRVHCGDSEIRQVSPGRKNGVSHVQQLRRQLVARTVYALWTSGGSDESALAPFLLDGSVDAMGMYMTFSDDMDDNTTSKKQTIDWVHRDGLSYHDFFIKYMLPNRPVVISGLTENWKSSKEWVKGGEPNLEFLREWFGNDVAPVHVQSQGGFATARPDKEEWTVSDYADWWQNKHGKETSTGEGAPLLYLKDWKFVAAHPSYGAYNWPEYFRDDWLNGAMGNAYKFVYLGPPGTCTRLHADVLQSYSWSTNVCGRKRWYLIPPQYTHLLYDCFGGSLASHLHADTRDGLHMFFPGLHKARQHAIEVMQEAGETIFVPSGWHHTVENLEPTLSINHNWLNGTNVAWSWDMLQKEIDSLHDSTSIQIAGCATEGGKDTPCSNSSNSSKDTSQVGDDLLLLWLILSKKARAILFDDSQPVDDAMQKFNLRAILPILEGIELVIRDGKDQGLTKRCDCDIDDLIEDVKSRLENC